MAFTVIIYMAKGKSGNNASLRGIFEIFPKNKTTSAWVCNQESLNNPMGKAWGLRFGGLAQPRRLEHKSHV
jgi:hypothetical protein